MASEYGPRSGVKLQGILTRYRGSLTQLASFGLVGGIAFIVDLGIYNLLRLTVLSDAPIWSKVASAGVSMVVAWLGNRHLTFRKERGRALGREAGLFFVMNVIGLCISAGCLWLSHYVLGFTSPLADNIAGNGIGVVLGTVFRYFAYRFVVFRAPEQSRTSASPRRVAIARLRALQRSTDLSPNNPARLDV
jgi:putative flippase GtrA